MLFYFLDALAFTHPILFDFLSSFRFNLNKFLGHESRDAASIFADRSSVDSDWVKYAKVRKASAELYRFPHSIKCLQVEYMRLSFEEEVEADDF
jgi:hypothetical protein